MTLLLSIDVNAITDAIDSGIRDARLLVTGAPREERRIKSAICVRSSRIPSPPCPCQPAPM
ncbi:MAG: hypothetical protein ACREQ5_29845, partial [Candidatus Dormibacteria bacterium]